MCCIKLGLHCTVIPLLLNCINKMCIIYIVLYKYTWETYNIIYILPTCYANDDDSILTNIPNFRITEFHCNHSGSVPTGDLRNRKCELFPEAIAQERIIKRDVGPWHSVWRYKSVNGVTCCHLTSRQRCVRAMRGLSGHLHKNKTPHVFGKRYPKLESGIIIIDSIPEAA